MEKGEIIQVPSRKLEWRREKGEGRKEKTSKLNFINL